MTARSRLDLLLVERGLAPSREKARALVLAGEVRVDGQRSDKPAARVATDARLEVARRGPRYASRGGTKLESAWEAFGFVRHERVCLDVGASTGGFTSFLLAGGARKVYAVDVGYGQLAWELRQDERVVVLERLNARALTRGQVPEAIDLAAIDVSFISLEKVLPAVIPLLAEKGELIALVKPQFEAGRGQVGKKGVVRDPAVHAAVIQRVIETVSGLGLAVAGASFSKLRGPEGNIEFFVWARRGGEETLVDARALAEQARAHFEGASGSGVRS